MHSSLRQKLGELATLFTDGVLDAIRTSSLEELIAGAAAPREGHPSLQRIEREVERQSERQSPRVPAAQGVAATRSGRSTRGGRLPRRSTEDISSMLNRIVTLLRVHPRGLRAEQIRAQLGVGAKELPRPLAEGLSAASVRKTGQKRATTYFAAGRGARALRPGKRTSSRAPARRAQAKKK